MRTSKKYNTRYAQYNLIILIHISFNILHSSQNPHVIPNYAKIPGQSCDVVMRPNSQFDDKARNDMVSKVLSCVIGDKKLFVCYAGYRQTLMNEHDVKYRATPLTQKKTNRLTEIDLATKIEIEFSTPTEIDNDNPVIDIAQWEKNYYIAHNNNINVYQLVNHNTLKLQHQFSCNIDDGDIIKKIFIHSNNILIAISQGGDIFHHPVTTSTSLANKSTIDPLIRSDTKEQTIHSFAYNAQKNLLLLGYTGFIKAVIPDAAQPFIFSIKVDPSLSIHTIDTYANRILFSNVMQNPDLAILQQNNGHLKKIYCCKEKATPKKQWKDCTSCIVKRKKWLSDKRVWENTPRTIVGKTPKQLASLQYGVPRPKSCSHRTCPKNEKNLPDSCRETIIFLINSDDLLEKISGTSRSCDIEVLKTDLLQFYLKESYLKDPDPTIITHTFIDDHFLFIGRSVESSRDIYKFPLQSLDRNTISSTLEEHVSFCDYNHTGQYIRYPSDNNPLLYDECAEENRYQCPILVNRNSQNPDDIIVVRIGGTCPFRHQGLCNNIDIFPERDHFFLFVYDTIVYSTKNKPVSMIENRSISTKRWWDNFNIKNFLLFPLKVTASIYAFCIIARFICYACDYAIEKTK